VNKSSTLGVNSIEQRSSGRGTFIFRVSARDVLQGHFILDIVAQVTLSLDNSSIYFSDEDSLGCARSLSAPSLLSSLSFYQRSLAHTRLLDAGRPNLSSK
jgi:hypothetical protein